MKSLLPKILICSVLCLILGTASGLGTISEIKTWFVHLNKPNWNPPNWLFGPAWTFLYITMGIALALIWHSKHANKKKAIQIFCIQFLFNLAWSFIFLSAHQIGFALIEICIMWLLILVTIRVFFKIDKRAAYLMVPYILWVSFATSLNAAIWVLN